MSSGPFIGEDAPVRLPPGEAARLDMAVRGLKPVERRILILSRLQAKSHAEIARELGMAEDEVRLLLVRVLLALARPGGASE
ncbi:MAG: sigma-70 region 4 domain-containing protein [Candidatus Andeanibacterium colombiense]|uniref:Sigma-70 region 4 domain-containing protein n=1 Tax=Candidatus Andeanibacterium colombiense TaxID=3121345 RepID=A0AAJ6BNB3_9SPHN|nr:MAG: sigma-70 region 4 domain-containing protein [Sphingomonadaceae bacterium]